MINIDLFGVTKTNTYLWLCRTIYFPASHPSENFTSQFWSHPIPLVHILHRWYVLPERHRLGCPMWLNWFFNKYNTFVGFTSTIKELIPEYSRILSEKLGRTKSAISAPYYYRCVMTISPLFVGFTRWLILFNFFYLCAFPTPFCFTLSLCTGFVSFIPNVKVSKFRVLWFVLQYGVVHSRSFASLFCFRNSLTSLATRHFRS